MPRESITSRFVQAMHQIIANNKTSGGKITNVRAFAKSIGHSSSNFSKFGSKEKTGREVMTDMIESVCRKHNVNPVWLILGTGSMFLKQKDDLETRVARLEKMMRR